MRVLGLAFAVLLAVTGPIAAHDNGPRSNMGPVNSGPAPGIVAVWPGRGSGGYSGAIGGQTTAGHVRQWNAYYGGWGPYGGPAVPTYWVWGPNGGAFDYPLSDWRGPTGGWGNP